jgi:hypothetical protein
MVKEVSLVCLLSLGRLKMHDVPSSCVDYLYAVPDSVDSRSYRKVTIIVEFIKTMPSCHHFLSRYFPPTNSNDPSATLRPKNSCSSSLLYGNPSEINILSIMAICCSAIVGELFVNMP